jgi:hypothetical protein
VHHLQQVFDQDNVAVLYVYCDYKDSVNQTDRNLFASLAKQSILQQRDLPTEAKTLFSRCKNVEISPSSEQCLDLLKFSVKHFRRTFVVLDALDELLPFEDDGYSPQIPLLSELNNIQQEVPGRLALFITSREIYSIKEQLHDTTRLDIRANDRDVRSYVRSRICDEKKFAFASQIRANLDISNEIEEKVVEKAQGM